ncbi:unnamed protein product [Amoebophrya sp. A25]|nr:unnamed protein product [Amoebophrya sp. A25]|eukprot:GSA25T00019078001.1
MSESPRHQGAQQALVPQKQAAQPETPVVQQKEHQRVVPAQGVQLADAPVDSNRSNGASSSNISREVDINESKGNNIIMAPSVASGLEHEMGSDNAADLAALSMKSASTAMADALMQGEQVDVAASSHLGGGGVLDHGGVGLLDQHGGILDPNAGGGGVEGVVGLGAGAGGVGVVGLDLADMMMPPTTSDGTTTGVVGAAPPLGEAGVGTAIPTMQLLQPGQFMIGGAPGLAGIVPGVGLAGETGLQPQQLLLPHSQEHQASSFLIQQQQQAMMNMNIPNMMNVLPPGVQAILPHQHSIRGPAVSGYARHGPSFAAQQAALKNILQKGAPVKRSRSSSEKAAEAVAAAKGAKGAAMQAKVGGPLAGQVGTSLGPRARAAASGKAKGGIRLSDSSYLLASKRVLRPQDPQPTPGKRAGHTSLGRSLVPARRHYETRSKASQYQAGGSSSSSAPLPAQKPQPMLQLAAGNRIVPQPVTIEVQHDPANVQLIKDPKIRNKRDGDGRLELKVELPWRQRFLDAISFMKKSKGKMCEHGMQEGQTVNCATFFNSLPSHARGFKEMEPDEQLHCLSFDEIVAKLKKNVDKPSGGYTFATDIREDTDQLVAEIERVFGVHENRLYVVELAKELQHEIGLYAEDIYWQEIQTIKNKWSDYLLLNSLHNQGKAPPAHFLDHRRTVAERAQHATIALADTVTPLNGKFRKLAEDAILAAAEEKERFFSAQAGIHQQQQQLQGGKGAAGGKNGAAVPALVPHKQGKPAPKTRAKAAGGKKGTGGDSQESGNDSAVLGKKKRTRTGNKSDDEPWSPEAPASRPKKIAKTKAGPKAKALQLNETSSLFDDDDKKSGDSAKQVDNDSAVSRKSNKSNKKTTNKSGAGGAASSAGQGNAAGGNYVYRGGNKGMRSGLQQLRDIKKGGDADSAASSGHRETTRTRDVAQQRRPKKKTRPPRYPQKDGGITAKAREEAATKFAELNPEHRREMEDFIERYMPTEIRQDDGDDVDIWDLLPLFQNQFVASVKKYHREDNPEQYVRKRKAREEKTQRDGVARYAHGGVISSDEEKDESSDDEKKGDQSDSDEQFQFRPRTRPPVAAPSLLPPAPASSSSLRGLGKIVPNGATSSASLLQQSGGAMGVPGLQPGSGTGLQPGGEIDPMLLEEDEMIDLDNGCMFADVYAEQQRAAAAAAASSSSLGIHAGGVDAAASSTSSSILGHQHSRDLLGQHPQQLGGSAMSSSNNMMNVDWPAAANININHQAPQQEPLWQPGLDQKSSIIDNQADLAEMLGMFDDEELEGAE